MTKKLCAIAAAVGALVWAAPAVASGGGGGPGALQAGVQSANTQQWAGSAAISNQNAVNANVPVSIAGHDVYSGSSTATQNADSSAKSKASNDAETNQTQNQTQNVGGSSCAVGCGGAGAAQVGAQLANTEQGADSKAISKQNAVNADVPVSIAGGNVSSGSSTADQTANSKADSKAKNDADTTQNQTQKQTVGGGSSCAAGCGGAGAAQIGAQLANTKQDADSKAISKQNAVNANVPVSIAGGDVKSGRSGSSATQKADSSAESKAKNDADTKQTQNQTQNVGGSSSCKLGCGGAGGFQAGAQLANTEQSADSKAISDQNAVNANVPVAIAGGDVYSGSSTADQTANSEAKSKATNDADTTQHQTQTQDVGGGSSCKLGCGGPGAAQLGLQVANTEQWADSKAISKQNAVNGNTPVNTAGGDIDAGSSTASQTANSEAKSKASNDADTWQGQEQTQNVGSARDCKCGHDVIAPKDGRDGKDSHDCGCDAGSGGAGGFQAGAQVANTEQWADSKAISKQNAVNGNSPHNTAGGDVKAGDSSATQNADSKAKSKAKNEAATCQLQNQAQNVSSGRVRPCGHDKKPYERKQKHDGKKGHDRKGGYDRKKLEEAW